MIDGPNLYAYVTNDPINYIDPMGTQTLPSTGDSTLPSYSGASQDEAVMAVNDSVGGGQSASDCPLKQKLPGKNGELRLVLPENEKELSILLPKEIEYDSQYYKHEGPFGTEWVEIPNGKVIEITETGGSLGYPQVLITYEDNRMVLVDTMPEELKTTAEVALVGTVAAGGAYGAIIYGPVVASTVGPSVMTWAASPQGQNVINQTADFMGGWFPTGSVPPTPAGHAGAAVSIFIGDPEEILK